MTLKVNPDIFIGSQEELEALARTFEQRFELRDKLATIERYARDFQLDPWPESLKQHYEKTQAELAALERGFRGVAVPLRAFKAGQVMAVSGVSIGKTRGFLRFGETDVQFF